MLLLGLDIGTTNVKALVVDPSGRPLASESRPVGLRHVDGGGVEQDIEALWAATLGALREVAGAVEASDIAAVGVSSQGGAMQVVGPYGELCGHVISWLDGRGQADDDRLTRELGREWFTARTGHAASGLAVGQMLRLRREGVLTPDHRVGFVGDLIVGRLCGRAAHDGTSAGLTLLYNPSLRAYDPDVLTLVGLTPERLPDLLAPCTPAGGLLPDVARQAGLTPGIPVSAAVHDQYAAALGCAAVATGDVMLGAGTAWVLLAVTDHLAAPATGDAFACHHVVDGLYGQIVSLRNGGSAVGWALGCLRLDAADGPSIDALLEPVPAGCDGLTFWPFLAPGCPVGVPEGARGRFHGLHIAHRPAHLLRAVVEGLACELNRHLAMLRGAGMCPSRLLMCGAAARSQVTPQVVADVTGLPVDCLGPEAGSALGAGVLARGVAEPCRSLAGLARGMVRPGATVEPGAAAATYAEVYARYVGGLLAFAEDGSG